MLRTQPVVFSPLDPHVLYFTSNTVWKTTDGGRTWEEISPDLTRASWDVPTSVGKYRAAKEAQPTPRGVVYALAPSPLDAKLLWAGTDDGLVHVTRDGGKQWTDVTPKALVPWAKVAMLEASHFDRDTAWVAVNTFKLDDTRPHVYRTRDGGRSWEHVTAGIPDDEGIVNTVREDPVRRDLLYAGTERQVWVSFDGGDHWQSLRVNMPATSVRDLVVKGDDLVAGTHGRGFWILDDVTALRQLDPAGLARPAQLFAPQAALRFRANKNTDTPLPPDEPGAPNPPEGAVLDYHLASAASRIVLEVVDAAGRVVRRYASDDPALPPVEGRNIPDYWIRPPQRLSAAPGLHRFSWDLREPAPQAASFSYPIAAVLGDTPREPRGPWVVPGSYTVRLTVDGRVFTQPLTVRMDPRVKTTPAELEAQHALSTRLCDAMRRAAEARGSRPTRTAETEGGAESGGDALARVHGRLGQLLEMVEETDARPTPAVEAAVDETIHSLDEAIGSSTRPSPPRPGP